MSSALGRGGRLALGWTLLVLGVAALVLPGPGLLLVAAGLSVLSQQYDWARRRVDPIKDRAFDLARASVRSRGSIALSLALAAATAAVGVVWGLHPPAPGWWPLDERWWLPGGWGTGSSLLGSALIAVGLLGYSHHRFRPRPDRPVRRVEQNGLG